MAELEDRRKAVDKDYALSMGIEEFDWDRIVDRMGRAPNAVECVIFAALWSEEVCNKSTSSMVSAMARDERGVIKISGTEIGVIELADGRALVVRMLSNNAQSRIDANTAVQMCQGATLGQLCAVGAEPIAMLNLLRFGNQEHILTHKHFQQTVRGLETFSNTVGVPAAGGELYFHPSYDSGMLVNSFAIGIIEESQQEFSCLNPPPAKFGDVLLYVGAATGLDGLNKPKKAKLDEIEALVAAEPEVYLKVSDSFFARRLANACRDAAFRGDLTNAVYLSVGGLATGLLSVVRNINQAVRLTIDRIPKTLEQMSPEQIMLSESSERMLIVASKDKHIGLLKSFQKWNIPATVVGEVIDSDNIEYWWHHHPLASIPRSFSIAGTLTKKYQLVQFPPMLKKKGVDYEDDYAEPQKKKLKRSGGDEWSFIRDLHQEKSSSSKKRLPLPQHLEDVWLDLMANPNLCSRKTIFENLDQTMGGRSKIVAGGDAAVFSLLRKNSKTPQHDLIKQSLAIQGLAITLDSNSLYVSMEPYLGTVQTVAEGMRNLAACGAQTLAMAYSLNFGDPNRYREVCDMSESIRGLGDASKHWEIPILSEHINLFNGSDGTPIMPTPAVVCIGLIDDISKACPMNFREEGDRILLIGSTKDEIACSEYSYYCHHQVNDQVPEIDFELEQLTCRLIRELINQGLLSSAHDVSAGGVAMALTRACLSREVPIGATLELKQTLDKGSQRADVLLFSETSARFLVSCSPENEAKIRAICAQFNLPITGQGTVEKKSLRFTGTIEVEIQLATAHRIWSQGLNHIAGEMSVPESDLASTK